MLSECYMGLAKKITKKEVEISENPKYDITKALDELDLIKN